MEIKARYYLVTMIISGSLSVASRPFYPSLNYIFPWAGYFTVGLMLLAFLSLLSLVMSVGYQRMEKPALKVPRSVHYDRLGFHQGILITIAVIVIVAVIRFPWGPIIAALLVVLWMSHSTQDTKTRIHKVIVQHQNESVIPYGSFIEKLGISEQSLTSTLESMITLQEISGYLDANGYHT